MKTQSDLLKWSVGTYLIFVLLPIIGFFSDVPYYWLSELLEAPAIISIFTWPYPLLLTLQTWVSPDSILVLVITDVLGIGVVWIWYKFVTSKILSEWPFWLLAFSWLLPLITLEVLAFILFGSILGLPVGE